MDSQPLKELLHFISKPTPRLLDLLAPHQRALSTETFDSSLKDIRSVFEKYTDALRRSESGIPRAQCLHRLLEEAIKTAAAVQLSCHKGCSGCCHYEVGILKDEAELLAQLIKSGVSINLDRLQKQASRQPKDPAWTAFFSEENRCVFLDPKGACRVYENRPAACRRLIVTSPPAACTTLGAPVEPVGMLLVEILMSAAISLPDTQLGSLPQLLRETQLH